MALSIYFASRTRLLIVVLKAVNVEHLTAPREELCPVSFLVYFRATVVIFCGRRRPPEAAEYFVQVGDSIEMPQFLVLQLEGLFVSW